MNFNLEENIDEIPSLSKDEYISSLEISIQLLQKEIENLKKSANVILTENSNLSEKQNILIENIDILINAKNKLDLIDLANKTLENSKLFLEWVFYDLQQKKQLTFTEISKKNSKLLDEINELEENGVLEWVLSNDDVKIAPSLNDSSDEQVINNIFAFSHINKGIILFFGKIGYDPVEFNENYRIQLKQFLQSIAINFDKLTEDEQKSENLIDSKTIQNFNNNTDLIRIALSEFDLPIQIIESNIDLLDKGIGDSKKRLEIVNSNIKYIRTLKSKFENLILEDFAGSEFRLNDLIQDIKFLTTNYLHREGVELSMNLLKNYSLSCDYKSLENIITLIILLSTDLMPESGNLMLSTQKRQNKIIIKFYLDSAVFTNSDFEKILYNTKVEELKESAFLKLKAIINIVNSNNFEIEVINDKKIGTTFALKIK